MPSTSAFTSREREVLALMALGHSNSGICAQLFIAPKTLETHVQRIFWKLDLVPEPGTNRRVCAVLAWMGAPSVIDDAEALTPRWERPLLGEGRFARAPAA